MKYQVHDASGQLVAEAGSLSEGRQRMVAAGLGAELRRGSKLIATNKHAQTTPPPVEEVEQLVAAPSSVTFVREVITPELATAILEKRAPNRTVNQERVASYATDMVAGRWADTHQPVALGPNGELIDGEHRMRAVVRANVPVAMWVARGVALDNRWAIDQGRARSVGDALKINDGIAYGAKLASWCRVIENLRVGWRAVRVVSPAQVRDIANRHVDSIAWALEHAPCARPLGRAPITAALIFAHRVLPEATEAFTKKYASGEGLVAKEPAYAMRQSVLLGVRSRETPKTYALRTLRCVLAEHREEQMERVAVSEDALMFFVNLHSMKDGAR